MNPEVNPVSFSVLFGARFFEQMFIFIKAGQHQQQLRAFASAFGSSGRSFLDPRSCLSSLANDWSRGLTKTHHLSSEKWSLEISHHRPDKSALMCESNTWNPLQGFNSAASSYHSSYAACSAAATVGSSPFTSVNPSNHSHGIEMSSLFSDANGTLQSKTLCVSKRIHIV